MAKEIRIHVTNERLDELTVHEMVAVENVGEGIVSMKALRGIIAKFVLNGDGSYLPEDEALKLVDEIKRPQFLVVTREFFAKVNDLAVNPTTGSDS